MASPSYDGRRRFAAAGNWFRQVAAGDTELCPSSRLQVPDL